jgi:hypothetical protein
MQRFAPDRLAAVEINPQYNLLEDLTERSEALRGYL